MSLTPSAPRTTLTVVAHRVVIVTYPGIQGLDLVGPLEVFTGAAGVVEDRRPAEATAYRVEVVSADGGPIRTESGLAIHTDPLPEITGPIDTLLVAGGFGVYHARQDERLVAWLRSAAATAGRVGSVCTGAFLLADIGVLDGCTVTTHWARADRLAADHPSLTVDPDPIYTRTGRIWTSAGVTAGIDLALAMVEDDHGTDVAQTVARWLVMFLHRPGGQTQFATPVWSPRAERSAIRGVQQAVEDDPSADHRVPTMAALAAMSPRHFTRVFTDEVGESPGHWVERVRIDAARRLLTDTTDTVAVIARRCGFGSAETMRRAFVRRVGVAPDHYRRRFAVVA
jgi:transcriptional regulator GlxA family with amidase domain